jgi:hypothetical protein
VFPAEGAGALAAATLEAERENMCVDPDRQKHWNGQVSKLSVM